MKKIKLTYYISTGLITALMLMSVGMYLFNNDHISSEFERMAFPSFLVYPLAMAKILGLIAIWTNKSATLKEWAYAGFFFNFVLAFAAHFMVGDNPASTVLATILILTSYFSWKRMK